MKNLRAFFSRGEREEREDDGLLRAWKTDDTTNAAPKAFRAVVVVRAAAAALVFFFCPQSEDVSASSRNG